MNEAEVAGHDPRPRRGSRARRRPKTPSPPSGGGDESMLQYMPRIERIARGLARRIPPHIPLEDLVSAGTLGLLDAAQRYDPARCDRFEAFAEPRIRGAMLDELRSHDTLSRELRSRWRRTEEVTSGLHTSLGRAPSEEEIAAELDLSLEELAHLRTRVGRAKIQSAEALSRDGSGAQAFADRTQPDPYQVAAAKELRDHVARALEALPERLRLVASLYYKDGLTLSEIGGVLGVTEARACQLRGEAVRKTRAILDAWKVRDE